MIVAAGAAMAVGTSKDAKGGMLQRSGEHGVVTSEPPFLVVPCNKPQSTFPKNRSSTTQFNNSQQKRKEQPQGTPTRQHPSVTPATLVHVHARPRSRYHTKLSDPNDDLNAGR